jgi:YhcH/YjgK/YiaL family protein
MIVCPWKDLGRYAPIIPGLAEAMEAVAALTDWTPRTIALSDGNKILVQEGTTKDASTQLIEAHRNYLDIQYIVQGSETMGWAPIEALTPAGEYNAVKDKIMYAGHVDFMDIAQGYCYVVYPEDGHMPGVHLKEPQSYRKLVVKLKV